MKKLWASSWAKDPGTIGYVLLFVQGRRRRGAALLWNGFALAFAALIVGILVMPTG